MLYSLLRGCGLVLVVALALGTPITAAHKCIHHEESFQELITATMSKGRHEVVYRLFDPQSTFEPIRIVFNTENLADSSKYCSSMGESRPDFRTPSNSMVCGQDDILTQDKIDIITTRLMPAVVEIIQSYLKVNRVVGDFPLTPNACGPSYKMTSTASNNTDFYILISAGPVGNIDTVAYAAPCATDVQGRPIIGRINFNPYFLKWDALNPSANNDNLVHTAHREIAHSLGFTSTMFNQPGVRADTTVRGKSTKKIVTPTVVEVAKQYFNCSTIDGVELEDEGAAGSQWAHWDRRIVFEELMTSSVGSRTSAFTLAFFKDLGYYDVDMSHAAPLTFGRGAGCGFTESKCNTLEGGLGKYWCDDSPSQEPAKSCTFDRRSIGYCNTQTYSAPLDCWFQYFSDPRVGGVEFVDKCPYVVTYSNRGCAYQRQYAANEQATQSAEADLGFYFGAGGRCFDTGGLKRSTATATDTLRCMKARCPFNGSRVEVLVGSQWLCCPLDGSAQNDLEPPAEFKGSIKCPQASDICDSEISFGSDRPESKPLNNTELRVNAGTANISVEVIFNGTGWSNVIASDLQRMDLFNSALTSQGFYE